MRRPRLLLVGLYAWTVTVAFGAALVDVVYAAQMQGDSIVALAEASDFLLGVVLLTVLAAIGAIVASWEWKPSRNLLVASLLVLVAGLLTPALLSDIIRNAEGALGVRVGALVRLGEGGLASILAFIGLWESWRKGVEPAPG
jgi:hypothetical protein